MKLGILGTGMIVKDLLTTINKLKIESISILGTEQTKKETTILAKQYHLDHCYYDYDEMLRSEIDTVYVALPNHLHFSFAKKALLKGKHVIMEKPITSNVKELEELKEIAQENDLIILEAVNIHYLPAFKNLKEDIKRIGNIKIMNFNYSQYSSRYDSFKQGTILPAFDYHKSGGALMDINVYNVNAIISLFGQPVSIGYMANIENQIDTSGILMYDYGSFKGISIGAKDCKAPIISTIQGDKGVIKIDKPVNQMTGYQIIFNDGTEEIYRVDDCEHRLYYEFIEFIRIIDNNDYDFAKKMLELSLIVAKVMNEARNQEKIVFTNDN